MVFTLPSCVAKNCRIAPKDRSVNTDILIMSTVMKEKSMQLTAELRWFNHGTLPKEISHWFEQAQLGDHIAPPEEREDVYLYVAECDYLGIKLRQGRLEIKWRQAKLDVVSFGDSGDSVEGKAEKWGKWLCEDPTSEIFQPTNVVGKSWVSVRKVRSQRQYQVLAGKSVIAVADAESIDQGCSVELTELYINGNAWWSLAFEAFGEDDCLKDNLQAVAKWVFKSYSGPKLRAENSYAYPSWLCLAV